MYAPDSSAPKTNRWLHVGCALFFVAPLLLFSLFFLVIAFAEWQRGEPGDAAGAFVFALVVGSIGLAPVLRWRRSRLTSSGGPWRDREVTAAPRTEPGPTAPDIASKSQHERIEQEAAHPKAPRVSAYGEAPWLQREAWRHPRIEAKRDNESKGIVIFGLAWLAMTGGAAFLYALGIGEGGSPGFFIGLALVGIGVVAVGARRILKRRKYGRIVLELDELPGAIGGTIQGRVETGIPATQPPTDGFRVMLTCYRKTWDYDPEGGRSASHTVLWRDEARMRGLACGDEARLAVPFCFRIPPDQPESTPAEASAGIVWRVEVSAEMPGIDFDAAIDVPVFVVENRRSTGDGGPEDVPYAAYQIHRRFTAPVSPGITMEDTPEGGIRFYFGPARSKGVATTLTVLFLICAGLLSGAVIGGGIDPLAILVLLFFAAASGYGSWHYWTFTSSVTVARGRIVVRAGPLGRRKVKSLPCAALAAVEVATRTDAMYDLRLVRGDLNDEARERLRQQRLAHYRSIEKALRSVALVGRRQRGDGTLEAHLQQHGLLGDTIKAADRLRNRREAEWIAARIEDRARQQA